MPETPQMSARLAVVIVSLDGRERHLHVPAKAGVERQRRRQAPGVLGESRIDIELARAAAAAEVDVFVRLGIERGLPGDRNDAAGQQRVELARVGQLRRRRALEVGGGEQARRRIVGGVEPEIDAGRQLLRIVPRAAQERAAAEGEAVVAFLPVQRLVEACTDSRCATTACW